MPSGASACFRIRNTVFYKRWLWGPHASGLCQVNDGTKLKRARRGIFGRSKVDKETALRANLQYAALAALRRLPADPGNQQLLTYAAQVSGWTLINEPGSLHEQVQLLMILCCLPHHLETPQFSGNHSIGQANTSRNIEVVSKSSSRKRLRYHKHITCGLRVEREDWVSFHCTATVCVACTGYQESGMLYSWHQRRVQKSVLMVETISFFVSLFSFITTKLYPLLGSERHMLQMTFFIMVKLDFFRSSKLSLDDISISRIFTIDRIPSVFVLRLE
jgi:hypothetical protein